MRITELAVDGFGLLNGYRLTPSSRLTLVSGENEAGKSTLLAFVRAILFGFETNEYRALAGGRRGGWLDLEMTDGRSFRVERYGDRGGAGQLRVLDASRADLGGEVLPNLLRGVEKTVYRSIFAFGLGELTEFRRLTDEEVAARIYGAGLGLGGALDVEAQLKAERDGLFKPGGHNPVANELLRELDEVDSELRRLDLPAAYAADGERLVEIQAELDTLDIDLAARQADSRALERLIAAWPTWLDLGAARADRAAIGAVLSLPANALERYGVLDTNQQAAEETHKEVATRHQNAVEQMAALHIDERLLDRRDEIESLVAAGAEDRARSGELARLGRDHQRARAELDAALERLGPAWTEERVAAFDDSIAVQTAISGRFRTLLEGVDGAVTAATGRLEANRTELEDTRRALEAVRARIEEIDEDLGTRGSVSDREAALQSIDNLRVRLEATRPAGEPPAEDVASGPSLADRLRMAAEARSLLEREQVLMSLAGSRAARPVGNWPMLAIAGAGVLGGAVVVAAGAPPVLAAAILLVALAAAGLVAWAVRGRGEVDRTSAGSAFQAGSARALAAPLLEELGMPGSAGLAELQVTERTLDDERLVVARLADERERFERATAQTVELEGRLATELAAIGLDQNVGELDVFRRDLVRDRELEGRRSGLLEQRELQARGVANLEEREERLGAEIESSETRRQVARTEWARWLEEHGLETDLDRESAARVVDAVTTAKARLASASSFREQLGALAAAREAFERLVDESADLLEDGRGGRSSADIVRELARRLKETVRLNDRRGTLAGEIAELEQQAEEARAAAMTREEEVQALLDELGVPDAPSLRLEVERSSEAARLDGVIGSARAALTALSGPGEALATLEAALAEIADIDAVHGHAQDVAREIGDLDARRSTLLEESGAVRDRRASMERDVEATQKRQRRSDLQARLESVAEHWAVLAIAAEMVANARQAYEREHRPAVVSMAERYFRDWTAGRYERIVAPIGRQIEGVEHRDGTLVPLTGLSRGTAEQLYLAMRFGLVEHFAQGGEALPIVMDDVLVNFDPERAERAARSIEELANRHQILYFTCHPTTPLRPDSEIKLAALRGLGDSTVPA